MNKQSHRFTLLLILLFGYALRLYRLGAQSLWYDETVSAVLAQKSIPELIAHTARDIHPPGYYLLLHGWTRLAGDSEFALAYFSLVFGILLIASVYALGRLLLNEPAALWAAGLVALSPYNVWYSQEVRMYTLGAFLGVMAVYFALKDEGQEGGGDRVRGRKGEGRQESFTPSPPHPLTPSLATVYRLPSTWIFYTLFAAAGLYTLYYFAFLLIAFNLFLLIFLFKSSIVNRQSSIVNRQSSIAHWLLANLAVLILYLPWLPIAWKQATTPPVPPWRSSVPLTSVVMESWSALSLGESVEPGQVWLVLLITLLLFGLGLYVIQTTWKRILLPTLTFGPLAIILLVPLLTGSPLYHVRYLFTYSPAFYLVLGAGLAWLWNISEAIQKSTDEHRLTQIKANKSRRIKNLHPKKRGILCLSVSICGLLKRSAAALAIAGLLWGSAFSIYQMHTNPQYASDDFRSAVAFLQEKWRPGDAVLINAGYTYTALQYYFTDPVDGYQRLTDFDPQTSQTTPYHPLILQSGMVDGLPSLGWGDPQSDFYAMSQTDAIEALERVAQSYSRIWMLRAYDTVTDSRGVIRQWLHENTIQFEDQVYTGASNIRAQGFLSRHQPPPPRKADFNFENRLQLRGYVPPLDGPYRGGQAIHTVLWLEALSDLSAEAPFALSLKLWDSEGHKIAQSDEWPVGSLYFTPNWPPDEVIRHPMRLILAPNIEPGRYWLDVEVYRSDTGQPLEVAGAEKHGVTLGEIEVRE